MLINQIPCAKCMGQGKCQEWVPDKQPEGQVCKLVLQETTCRQCDGKGYTEYPVFTVEEALKIAEYFGFEVNR